MYNEELKRQYLEQANERYGQLNNLVLYFGLTEDMEKKLGKDISQFSLVEITEFYKSLCTPSELYIGSINSQLSMYTRWCINQAIVPDNQNHFDEVNTEIYLMCVNKNVYRSYFITKDELLVLINGGKIPNVSDAFMILAFFEGICGAGYEELLSIRPEDIAGNKIHLHGKKKRVLTISDKLIELAYESAETYQVYTGNNYETVRELEKGDARDTRCFKKFRTTADPTLEKYAVIKRIKKLQEYLGLNSIGSKSLLESGRMEMIKQRMKETGMDAEHCLRDKAFRVDLYYRYGALQNISVYCKKISELLES